jgi:cell division protein FtsZ
MGSGFGEGENRAQEAAQEAISSPLLDEVSIAGARGVLINITGGMDLAIDEVTEISSIIQEGAGDEAEIIFGAVHDPDLEGKIRVTVIATGFDSVEDGQVISSDFQSSIPMSNTIPNAEPILPDPQIQIEEEDEALVGAAISSDEEALPLNRFPEQVVSSNQLLELDIPTFIRRQMD